MAAFSLFRGTNMAIVTSCENRELKAKINLVPRSPTVIRNGDLGSVVRKSINLIQDYRKLLFYVFKFW